MNRSRKIYNLLSSNLNSTVIFTQKKKITKLFKYAIPCFSFSLSFVLFQYYFGTLRKQIFLAEKNPKTLTSGNEIIFLSKHDYLSRILGNDKEFFFMIVYDDQNHSENALSAAKSLKSTLDNISSRGINVYLITRSTLTDIKKIIGRTKNINLFQTDDKMLPIEVYYKTPHSKDFMYLNFNPRTFFTPRKQKKISKRIIKLNQIVDIIDNKKDNEDFLSHLRANEYRFNVPTIIMSLPEGKKENEKIIAKFKKIAFICLERKFLPLSTKFIIIQNKKISEKYGLDKNIPYIIHNDIITAYEKHLNNTIESKENNDYIKINIEGPINNTLNLQKYTDGSLFQNYADIQKLSIQEKKIIKSEKLRNFINFIFPRIILLKDMKYRNIGQLIKKSSIDKEKYILSLYCSPFDHDVEQKMNIFMDIYKRHKNNFVYVIFENDAVADMFPHATHHYPSFALFNYFKQQKQYKEYQNYYNSLIYPYEKYFLNKSNTNKLDLNEINTAIDDVLQGRKSIDYLSVPEGFVLDLCGRSLDDHIKNLISQDKNALIEVYDDSWQSNILKNIVNKLAEELKAIQGDDGQIKFIQINKINKAKSLLHLKSYPALFYLDSETKTIHFYSKYENNMQSENDIKEAWKKFRDQFIFHDV